MRLRACAAAAICALALGACGSGGGATTTASSATETLQPLPKLPPGWQARVTRSGTSLLRTADRRIAVSISADRTDQALTQPLGAYATGAAASLGGLKRIKVRAAAPFPHRYAAVQVRASGVGAGGVHEKAFLVALRRDHLASFVVASLRRAAIPNALYRAQVTRIVKTLRSRPIE